MKQDLQHRKDIEQLINHFYSKVKVDDEIGYFFTEIVPVDWEKHLPVMYDFWESIVFNTGSFTGNPMTKHQLLHQKSPLNKAHFQKWLKIFNETVDELFEGENAFLIKQRALSIATVMQIKVLN